MKRMKYSLIFFLFLLSMLVVPTITAQNATDEIQYKITGRMLMDGGIYLKNPVDFGNGTEFNDLSYRYEGYLPELEDETGDG